ncbi:DUF429 domain-containing protein [Prosthecomicrobium sp. N25]|uniref:DUF429 domain-containing protein n=1 Tax=Prosthecomicrobium sp. N25 TaxID=3129254 RepID=UPI0030775DC8
MSAAGSGPDRTVAGVDGCPAGWIAVTLDSEGRRPPAMTVHRRFAEILESQAATIAVDMPIGLPDRILRHGRAPERVVRRELGERQSSVFSVPSRSAVWAGFGMSDHDAYRAVCAEALATSDPPRKISKQCFHLLPKIREIDGLMTPALAGRVFEVHPEVAFWRLNDGQAMRLPKKVKGSVNPAGLEERIGLLERFGYDRGFLQQPLPSRVGRDDLVDAAVAALIARRLLEGTASPFPDPPERDSRGLTVAIWA